MSRRISVAPVTRVEGHLSLKLGALIRKCFRYALTNLGNEFVRLPGSLSRVIDKTYLNSIPA